MVVSVGILSVMRYRSLKHLKGKVDRGEARWEDDWDPFS
jgi:hypothetical protein